MTTKEYAIFQVVGTQYCGKLAFFVRQGVTTKEYAIFRVVRTQYYGKRGLSVYSRTCTGHYLLNLFK